MTDSESIYRQFVQFEEKAASIYLRLASRFSKDPELSSFWLEMALHEKQHAGLVEFCCLECLFAQDLPDSDEIQKLASFSAGLEKRAADPNLTPEEAFAIAIEMEASEINAIYCRLTTVLHSSIYLLRRKIAISLPNHIDGLLLTARKFGLGEDALQHLCRVKERCSDQWRSPN
jgi:rubrerythrin